MEKEDVTIYIYPSSGQKETERLLPQAAMRYAGGEPDQWEIARQERGKPYFLHQPAIHFSISHSGDYWACAFGSQPLGLDLQKHQTTDAAALSKRFFHPDEDAYLQRGKYRDFFAVWSAKESVVKYTGQGLIGGISSFSVISPAGELCGENAQLRIIPFQEGYSLCLCGAELGEVSCILCE